MKYKFNRSEYKTRRYNYKVNIAKLQLLSKDLKKHIGKRNDIENEKNIKD